MSGEEKQAKQIQDAKANATKHQIQCSQQQMESHTIVNSSHTFTEATKEGPDYVCVC